MRERVLVGMRFIVMYVAMCKNQTTKDREYIDLAREIMPPLRVICILLPSVMARMIPTYCVQKLK